MIVLEVMFRTEFDDPVSFPAYALQLIVALLIPPFCSMIAIAWFAPVLAEPMASLADFGSCCCIGFALAGLVHHVSADSAVTGRWVWVVPSLFFATGFIYDVAALSFSSALSEWFYIGSNGEDGLGFVLLTCPTCGTVCYSLGMVFATRRPN